MPATQPQVGSITLAQYEALPEDKRVEVFDGVIYDMASPSQAHQTISMELSTLINTYIKKKKGSCRVFTAPFDVKLSDHLLPLFSRTSWSSVIKISWTEKDATVLLISSLSLRCLLCILLSSVLLPDNMYYSI